MSMRSLGLLATASLLLASCGSAQDEQSAPTPSVSASASSADSLLAEHGLEGLDVKTVIDRLDRLPVEDRPDDLMASVRPTSLVVSDPGGGQEHSLPMPEDEFYLSLAPYVDGTHDCFFHSLTTCRGELSKDKVDVRIETADGEVLVDESTTTFDNGFVGYWLPRDIDATITVTRGEQTGTAEISTGEKDLTCLTSLELA